MKRAVFIAACVLTVGCSPNTPAGQPVDSEVITGNVQHRSGESATGSWVTVEALPNDPPPVGIEYPGRIIAQGPVSEDGSFSFGIPADPDLVALADENGGVLNISVTALLRSGATGFHTSYTTWTELVDGVFQPAEHMTLEYDEGQPVPETEE